MSGSVVRGTSTGIGLGQIGLGLSRLGGDTKVISGGGTSSVKMIEGDALDWVVDPKLVEDRERVLGRVAGCGCDCERETGYQGGRDTETEDVVARVGETGAAAAAGTGAGGAVGVEVVVGVGVPGTDGSGVESAASNVILSLRVRRGT